MATHSSYTIQEEAEKVLWGGILRNPLHSSSLPPGIEDAAKAISFSGTTFPYIPTNWRFAESISSLKAFQGAMLNVLLRNKYGVPYQSITVDTDRAQLALMTPVHPWCVIDPDGEKISPLAGGNFKAYEKYFPNRDIHSNLGFDSTAFIDSATTNIYKLGDGKYYHLHGSLNPKPVQQAIGIDHQKVSNLPSFEAACNVIAEALSAHSANELDTLMNDKHRQAGTICNSIEEYRQTDHGKANAKVGLYEIHHLPNPSQPPTWWNDVPGLTSPARPLFGLKIVDLTRIIAAPTMVRDLAEMGANVMRVTAPHVTDLSQIQFDLGWGKWNASLDLRNEEDREKLRKLIMEADIVIDGYRPNVLKKWGFGKEEILEMVKARPKGLIYVHENCYGWNGPWAHRSGWQQISDANTGVSLEFGHAMGLQEPVTPVFPNADICTGISGATGVLQVLIERGNKGGSYIVDVAINYYNQWLVNSCGTYPPDIWAKLWSQYNHFVLSCTDNMGVSLPRYVKMLREHNTPVFEEKHFKVVRNRALNVDIRTVKPPLEFQDGLVHLEYNVGSRPNGTDKPEWPADLTVEVVA